jgi:hypothetical protein
MRLLVLSSIAPDFGHFRAGQTVLAVLLEALASSGVKVGVALAVAKEGVTDAARARLNASYIDILEGDEFSLNFIEEQSVWHRKKHYICSLFQKSVGFDYPHFVHSVRAVDRIKAYHPDVVLLFWDTWFEAILWRLKDCGVAAYGYLARPPQAAGLTNLSRLANPLRRAFIWVYLQQAQRRHIRRMRCLKKAANICALDASWYRQQGVDSEYISNTWPDTYGKEWKLLRSEAEGRRTGIHILANIGGLNATGNRYGMQFLGLHVLPLLKREMDGEWVINICGRFELPSDLMRTLTDEHVHLKGFVPDIDEEVAGNHIFLVLNNAGPYTGGYTRVIYAFSSGSCLIAHRRLAESMPELIHGENCLLGETPEEIAKLIVGAASNASLRKRLAAGARETYVTLYSTRYVAQKLMAMVSGGAQQ